jgi:ATP-binding cassette subfamily C protein
VIPTGEQPIDGQHVVLEGNQPLLLDRSGIAWLVKSGLISVFAVDTGAGALHGERQFLFEVGAGEVLLGTTTAARLESRQECIGVAVQTSALETLPIAQLAATARGRLALQGWLTKQGVMLQALKPNAETQHTIAAGQKLTVKSGETVGCSGDALLWITVRYGSLRLMGYDEGQVDASDELLPLPPGLWLQSIGAAELEASSPAEISSDTLLRAARLLEPVCFRALEDLQQLARSERRQRFDQRRRLNQRLATETLRDLAAVSDEVAGDRESATSGTPLLIAAQAVGKAQGLTIRPAVGDLGARRTLQAIALASGVRTRSVVLTGAWWTEENGPILAYRATDKAPAALIPARPSLIGQAINASRYTLFDPADGSWTPVDAAAAATLFSLATTFYRPFGSDRGTRSLILFALEFYRRDLAVMVLCALTVALFGMATPQAFAILVGSAIPAGDRGLVIQVALGMGAALLAAMLFDLTRAISTLRVQSGMAIALQTAAWDWLLKLRPAFFRKFSVGQLRSQIDGFTRIHEQLSPETVRVIMAGLAGSLYVGLMLYYSVPLGLLALVSGLLVIAATGASAAGLSRLQSSLQQMEASISGLMVQLINAVPKLRVAGAESRPGAGCTAASNASCRTCSGRETVSGC